MNPAMIRQSAPPASLSKGTSSPAGSPASGVGAESQNARGFAGHLNQGADQSPSQTAAAGKKLPGNESAENKLASRLTRTPGEGVEAMAEGDPAAAGSAGLKALAEALPTKAKRFEKAPALAFLTGRLGTLNPKEIPSLVTGNEFMKDAVSQGDIASFMQTPQTASKLLSALDVPQGWKQKAKQLGFDGGQKVSPRELLGALGVNVERVENELKMLKQNLPVSGVTPYIKRAKALAGSSQPNPNPPEATAKKPDRANPEAAADKAPRRSAFDPAREAMLAGAQTDAKTAAKAGEKAGASRPNPTSEPSIGKPGEPVTSPLSSAQSEGLNPSPEPKASAHPLRAAESALRNAEASLRQGQGAQGLNAGGGGGDNGLTAGGPRAHRATYDAFSVMGDKLKANGSKVFTAEEAAPSGKLHQTAVQNSKPDTHARLQAMATLGTLKTGAKTTSSSAGPTGLQSMQGKTLSGTTDSLGARLPGLGSAGETTEGLLSRRVRQDGQSSSQSFERSFHEGGSLFERATTPSAEQNGGSNVMETGFSLRNATGMERTAGGAQPLGEASGANSGPSTADRTALVQKLSDQATVMLRKGGGTARLDLGSAGLGQLEMAVKMDGDRVDVKMLTNSDKTRELLGGELSRLREALSQQNIRLGDVELGGGAGGESRNGRDTSSGRDLFQGQGDFSREDFAGQQQQDDELWSGMLSETAKAAESELADQAANVRGPRRFEGGRVAVRA